MKMFRYLTFSTLLVCSLLKANAQDWEKGVAASEAGNSKAAFEEWFPLAQAGDARAQTMIGQMYLHGDGVIQDYVSALNWNILAAVKGVGVAQTNLGWMYANGKGVDTDYVKAVKWYRSAADQGLSRAQLNLGTLYILGKGVLQNNVKAHMWLNIASANGEEGAQELRETIANKMTPEDISKAQSMANDCINSGYKNCDK